MLPIYNATKSGSTEIVTALLEFESPTSFLDQPKTPLLKSIKKGYLKIAYKLIEAGAFPDSDFNGYSPIKIAIERNDEKAFLLLLLAGASTDKILDEKLNENFKKILNKFKCKTSNSNSIFDNEIEQLIISLVQIQKEIKIFIDKSKDPSFLSKYLTPVINEINKKVVSVGNFVKKIHSFYKLVHNYRKELLSKQLSYLDEIEKNEIESKFEIDNNEWIELAKQTEDILKKHQNLPNDYLQSILSIQDQFLASKEEIFSSSKLSNSTVSEKVVIENRAVLLSINNGVLTKFYQVCSDAYNLILSLSQAINKILTNIEQILKKMRDLIINQQQLNFDFKNTNFELKSQNDIDDILGEKKSQLDLDLAFLKIENENFKSISTNLLRLIRYCID